MGGSEEIVTQVEDAQEEDLPGSEAARSETQVDRSKLASLLVSGGMDSCVTAAIANEENDELAFLHVSYGQRTEQRERQAFEALPDHYDVKSRLVISLEHLAKIGGSSLTDARIAVTTADLSAQ